MNVINVKSSSIIDEDKRRPAIVIDDNTIAFVKTRCK